jgi:hypothetical protein
MVIKTRDMEEFDYTDIQLDSNTHMILRSIGVETIITCGNCGCCTEIGRRCDNCGRIV